MNFSTIGKEPDPAKFDKGMQTVALLLEGQFSSVFENRLSAEMLAGLQRLGTEFKPVSEPGRMLLVSDGDVAANFVRDPTF